MCDLRQYIYSKSPGDTVNIVYTRNNRNYEIEVTLARKY